MKRTTKAKSVSPAMLSARMDPEKIPYRDSREIPDKNGYKSFQPRAVQALTMALRIKGNEYNIYAAGDANLGRTHFVSSFLEPAAAKAPTPPDWVYLYNFDDPDAPIAADLPPGQGRKFKNELAKAVSGLRQEIPARFECEGFQKKQAALLREYNKKRDRFFTRMESAAATKNFRLDMDDQGAMSLTPLLEDGAVDDKAFKKLPAAQRKQLKTEGDELLARIGVFLRRIGKAEQELKASELELQRQTAKQAFDEVFGKELGKFSKNAKIGAYLKSLEGDLLENIEEFLPREGGGQGLLQEPSSTGEDFFNRYSVNLFVDNGGCNGAPVVVETHPTYFNLLGSIEREAELGALHTDFTLVKAGSLHKANHGFLILNVEDVLSHPSSWEGLLRVLRQGRGRIEDPVDPEQVRARTIEPEPIPLDLKVILTGTDESYEVLLYNDDRFQKIFKLKAHLRSAAGRNARNIRNYLAVLGRIVREAGLLPFTRDALAGLVDQGSRLAEDQKMLSLHFPLLRERMIEASALAEMAGKKKVDRDMLKQAIADKDFRANLFEEVYMGEYDREVIKVSTGGSAVGRANGLSLTLFGDYEVGLPHQISCTVGVGHGGILDLEREAQLGGPIHTKGMMIIKSYLVGLFAQDKPIVLTGSLCFEQSYAGVEGDSASGAELAALLSALSDRPINLSLAFTGAVSQSGLIMAVGGVNRKVEGFFEVCRRRGLTGEQGVLVPKDNVVNLMLREEVTQAVAEGKFHIYPVSTIEQAMLILTGLPAGQRKNGKYTPGGLYSLVDQRLARLAELADKGDSKRG